MNAKTTKTETPKAACRTTRGHIARLMKMLEEQTKVKSLHFACQSLALS